MTDHPALTFGERTLAVADLIEIGRLSGTWPAFVAATQAGLALDRDVPAEDLRAAATAFRYERGLLAAADFRRWLDEARLTSADLAGVLRRTLLRERHEWPDAQPDIEPVLWAELICTGTMATLVREATDRLAAAHALQHKGPDPLGLHAALDEFAARVADADEVERRLAQHRIDWLRVTGDEAAFAHEGAAREARLLVREGEPLADVARLAGVAATASERLIESRHPSSPESSRQRFRASSSGHGSRAASGAWSSSRPRRRRGPRTPSCASAPPASFSTRRSPASPPDRCAVMSLSEPLAASLPLLDGLEGDVRTLVARSFVPIAFGFGDTVVRQGEPADAYYVIAEGTARVLVEDEHGEEISLNRLGPGDAFGEAALLEDKPRTATVRASSPLVVMRLDRGVFLAAVELHPALRERFTVQADARALGDFLRVHSHFAALDGAALAQLAAALTDRRLAEGEVALAQGDEADAMYIVQRGRLGVWVDGRRVRTLHAGDPFGELALVQRSARTATVRAEEPVVLLRLEAADFHGLVEAHPAFARRIEERIALYALRDRKPAAAAHGPPAHDAADPGLAVTEDGAEVAETPPRLKRRFPFVRQIDAMDCGAACLAMVCRGFGHDVSLSAIRYAAGTSTDGTSLRGLKRGGEEIGLRVRTVKSSADRLDVLPMPAIVHWGADHWVVLYRVEGDRVRIADPAKGLRRIARAELEKEWTGFAALCAPTERLADAPQSGLDLRWLWPFVRPHLGMLTLALVLAIAAAGLQMLLPLFSARVVDDAIPAGDTGQVNLILAADARRPGRRRLRHDRAALPAGEGRGRTSTGARSTTSPNGCCGCRCATSRPAARATSSAASTACARSGWCSSSPASRR